MCRRREGRRARASSSFKEAAFRTRSALAALLVALSACATARRAPPLPPLGSEGEAYVYAMPLARDADLLSFTVAGVALLREDGGEVPLDVVKPKIVGAEQRQQGLLAWGRVPPGDYTGLAVRTGSAALVRNGEEARLLVEPEPARVALRLRIEPGRAVVTWATLDAARSIRNGFEFAPAFTVVVPPRTPAQVALYCTNTASASVTAAQRQTKLVTGVLPVGGEPRGIALDARTSRAYVALPGTDEIEVLNLAAGAAMARVRLAPGDGPGEVALAAGGPLVVANERSRTAAFVDPVAMLELGRVGVGDAPEALLVDRAGRRAYVANRGSGSVSVIDVANRAVVGTLATDPEPLRMALSRDGTRLYVVHRGSAYVATFALPSLAPETRAYVGLGASEIRVDPRTDLVYLARADAPRIDVYDPVSLRPLDTFLVPGAVSRIKIDDSENTLLALMPGLAAVAAVDLTSRKLVAEIPVGAEPYTLAFVGERF